MLANIDPANVLIIIVAAITIAVAWRAIKNGKVGPQYGLSLKDVFKHTKDEDKPEYIQLPLALTEPQLYALLNILIDEVCQDEKHLLEPVLDAVGNVVSAHEKASGILP